MLLIIFTDKLIDPLKDTNVIPILLISDLTNIVKFILYSKSNLEKYFKIVFDSIFKSKHKFFSFYINQLKKTFNNSFE
jgi:hypothetical protein